MGSVIRRTSAGLPATDDEKSNSTEWTDEREERLSALAQEFEAFNGRIINVLAAFYHSRKPGA